MVQRGDDSLADIAVALAALDATLVVTNQRVTAEPTQERRRHLAGDAATIDRCQRLGAHLEARSCHRRGYIGDPWKRGAEDDVHARRRNRAHRHLESLHQRVQL